MIEIRNKNHICIRLLQVCMAMAAVLPAMTSCGLFETHPYDVDIYGDRDLTCKNIGLIESATPGRRSLRFAMISDTQGAYDETSAVVNAINREQVDFVLHGGDLSDYGMAKEFMRQRDIMDGFDAPYVCVIGNHDCLATGKDTYKAIFGPLNFAFTAGMVRFICLNTNALEYDYSCPVPDFGFLESELSCISPEIGITVFLMHVKPYEMVFNNNVAKTFQKYISSFPGEKFCLYGHEHQFKMDDLFGDGIIYYQCPDIAKRCYLLFTINEDNTYECELKSF